MVIFIHHHVVAKNNLYNKRRYVCLFVCLSVCSVWPAKRLGRSRRNLTHALMSTQGVFLARSMSRSFVYACGSDRIAKHPESDTWRTLLKLRPEDGEATPGERLRNSVRTTGNYSSSNEARRRAATPSGGRVITASAKYLHCTTKFISCIPRR